MQRLEEFVKELIEEVQQFEQYWVNQRALCSDQSCWPLELGKGDWFEMFLLYKQGE